MESSVFRNDRKGCFNLNSTGNQFAQNCLNNTTKRQQDKLKQLMEDVLIEQQKSFNDEMDQSNSNFQSNFLKNSREHEKRPTEILSILECGENNTQILSQSSIRANLPTKTSQSLSLVTTCNQRQLNLPSIETISNASKDFIPNDQQKSYSRKKNTKSTETLLKRSNLIKKLKESVKLKKEIVDLLDTTTTTTTTSTAILNSNSQMTINEKIDPEEKKLLINELNKKEDFLSENINRNILTLENFINTELSRTQSSEVETETENKNDQDEENKKKLFNNNAKVKHFNLFKNSRNRNFEVSLNDEQAALKKKHSLIFIEKDDPLQNRGKFDCGRYICLKCGISKNKLSELKQHLFAHASFRPFICYHCEQSFKTKGNLVKHVKTKAHLNKCVQMHGMDVNDEQITQVTIENFDRQLLDKQLGLEKESLINLI